MPFEDMSDNIFMKWNLTGQVQDVFLGEVSKIQINI